MTPQRRGGREATTTPRVTRRRRKQIFNNSAKSVNKQRELRGSTKAANTRVPKTKEGFSGCVDDEYNERRRDQSENEPIWLPNKGPAGYHSASATQQETKDGNNTMIPPSGPWVLVAGKHIDTQKQEKNKRHTAEK